MTLGYYVPGSTASFNLPVAFYTNTATDGVVPGSGTVPATLITALTITGLPGAGAWGITGIALPNVPVGENFWFEVDFAGAGLPAGGPLLTLNPGGTIGYSHSLFAQTGSMWGLTGGWPTSISASCPSPARLACWPSVAC